MPTLPLRNIARGDLASRASDAWCAAWFARRARSDAQRQLAALNLAGFRDDPNEHIRAIARPGPVDVGGGFVIDPDGGTAA